MDKDFNKEEMGQLFEEVANYFSLFCEPTRLKIMHAVCEGERSVGDIVTEVESTQANVSRQINMLYRARILARRKEGTQVYYRVDDEQTLELCKSVCDRIAAQIGNHRHGGQPAAEPAAENIVLTADVKAPGKAASKPMTKTVTGATAKTAAKSRATTV